MTRTAAVAALAIALAAAAWGLAGRRGATPDLVEDTARLMTAEQRAAVATFHSFLLDDYDIDYRVVTQAGSGDINLYAVERFEALAATIRSRTGRGLLLIVDPDQDRIRLEVGYALEGVFPDAFVAYVEERQMVPFFRQDRVADGILATTELIITRAQHAAANAGFEGEAWMAGSGGAGATAKAAIGAGAKSPPPAPRRPRPAGRSPEETLKAYISAMGAREASPDLGLYTDATRRMLRNWTITPAQMDTLARTYRACRAEAPRVSPDGTRAVIRYAIRERACAPWFFQRDGAVWRLDLTLMQTAIRFGRSNAWHFASGAPPAYRFAFTDWTFDSHGFPKRRR